MGRVKVMSGAWSILLGIFLLFPGAPASAEVSPVTYHLSFESLDFIPADDLHAKLPVPTTEQRNLSLAPGVFGKAFYNKNTFSQAQMDSTAMSTWDLDPLLQVLVLHRFEYWKLFPKSGHMEPYIWGTGRLKTDGGSVAFWAKGNRTFPGYLFFQGSSSFGRHEQYLLGIELNEDRSLSAYIRDARYAYHRISSKPVWKGDAFNHVALSWDRAQGLRLYLNGEEIASNWGADAWWATSMPGLFHMPMCDFQYDELWMFDRALSSSEVRALQKSNRPPSGPAAPLDNAAAVRLNSAFIGGTADRLPVVKPSDGTGYTRFREIYPERAGDGSVPAANVMDGKYELAWPVDYTTFTNILGDSDFHAEKVDFELPKGSVVNYITLDGNLTGARMLAGYGDMTEIAAVPEGKSQMYATAVDPVHSGRFRIPFLKGYGAPPGYSADLRLSLTGDIRIQEAGFFQVTRETTPSTDSATQRLTVQSSGAAPADNRCGYAMRAMNDSRNGRVLALSAAPSKEKVKWIAPGPFARVNLLSAPWENMGAVQEIELALRLRNVKPGDYAVVRLHDPGLPARIWTSVVFRLDAFKPTGDVLRISLDCTDIRMAPGDRIWADILFSGSAEIQTGGGETSTVSISAAPVAEAETAYGRKELQPSLTDYSRIYPWYYPWTNLKITPDVEQPATFGGFFDVVAGPAIVRRTEPDHFLSRILQTLTLIPFSDKAGVLSVDAWEATPALWPPIPAPPPDGAPEWAYYMRHYLKGYYSIVEWWTEHQNPDGQVGGGWKDDALFASRLPGVFLYLGDAGARGIFNKIYDGVEKNRLWYDGYCTYVPNDYIHVDDLTRNRYERLLYDLGDPHQFTIAQRTAWRFEKPDQTPINYVDGNSFKYDRDYFLWYWGETPKYPAWAITRDYVTKQMKNFAPAMNEVAFWRYTQSNVYTDYSYMPGTYDIKYITVGGVPGPWLAGLTMAVCWEQGGSPDITRWVESATDTTLAVHFYSYAPTEQEIAARLFRIKSGVYQITIEGEGKDASMGVVMSRTERLDRFSRISFPIMPQRELALRIKCIRQLPDPGPLPDLAVDEVSRGDGAVKAVVHNFGAAASPSVRVCLLDAAGRVVSEASVPALASARDFVPKKAEVSLTLPGTGTGYTISVDPDNTVREIVKTNNSQNVPER